jgi:NADH dehydrogenase FAD-containing subunit
MHKRLPKAETVLIVGGGPAGVETAGEIAYLYKPKEITILSGGTRLLPRMKNTPKAAKVAEQRLTSLNVKTVHNVRATSSTVLKDGKVFVELSDGSSKTVDVYVDATGGLPNTSFLPAHWLDDSKRVAADSRSIRATKAPVGVYAIGDVASYSKGIIPDATWTVPALGYSIWFDLRAAATESPVGTATLKEKRYKQIESDIGFVPVGPKGGVGVVFGWIIPSFFVWLAKSRTFMLEKAPAFANGADFLKP